MSDATPAPAAAKRPGTVHPHLARERALKVLFQADVRGDDPRDLLDRIEATGGALDLLDELEPDPDQVAGDAELQRELTRRGRIPLDDYTRLLVEGVASCRPSIDAVLDDVADRWTVARMPTVDRNLLRLAVYELVDQDTPQAVVLDEAVALAGAFAGDRAPGFVNGVLETVRQRVATGEVALTEVPWDEVVPPVVDADPHDDEERPVPLGDGRGTSSAPEARYVGRSSRPAAAGDDSGADDAPEAGPSDDAVTDDADGDAWDAALGLLSSLGDDEPADDWDDGDDVGWDDAPLLAGTFDSPDDPDDLDESTDDGTFDSPGSFESPDSFDSPDEPTPDEPHGPGADAEDEPVAETPPLW